MIIQKNILLNLAIMLVIGFTGCKKSETSDAGTSSTSSGAAAVSQNSAAQQEAQDAVMADLAKHWVKKSDGWTSALTGGSPGAPEHFLRQVREFAVQSIDGNDLSEADKLNGVQWTGSISFKLLTLREAGDPDQVAEGMSDPSASRQRGQWSMWVQYQPAAINAQKANNQWQISGGGTIRAGTIPNDSDYANAGVK